MSMSIGVIHKIPLIESSLPTLEVVVLASLHLANCAVRSILKLNAQLRVKTQEQIDSTSEISSSKSSSWLSPSLQFFLDSTFMNSTLLSTALHQSSSERSQIWTSRSVLCVRCSSSLDMALLAGSLDRAYDVRSRWLKSFSEYPWAYARSVTSTSLAYILKVLVDRGDEHVTLWLLQREYLF